jgi:hypothetical protein
VSAEVANVSGGIVTVRIAGKLTQAELAAVQRSVSAIIGKQGKVRILLLADKFEGWERGGTWDDLSFHTENDRNIERMAIVADKKWEDAALMFVAKGLRKFPIEHFEGSQLAAAEAWLGAK